MSDAYIEFRYPTPFNNAQAPPPVEHQELLSGLIRLHVLHHAAEGELYGQWIIEELGRHGYRLSPGTLYPMLHALEHRGYLTSRIERVGRSQRRLYRATPHGIEALAVAREKLGELVREIVPHPDAGDAGKTSPPPLNMDPRHDSLE